MKYVMIRVRVGGVIRELPIIFPDIIVHRDLANALLGSCEGLVAGRVVSAGFINSMDMQVDCAGKSESIGVPSRPSDSDNILMHDYLHGIVT